MVTLDSVMYPLYVLSLLSVFEKSLELIGIGGNIGYRNEDGQRQPSFKESLNHYSHDIPPLIQQIFSRKVMTVL